MIYAVVVAIGFVLLFVPGVLAFVFLALAAPIVEIEGHGVRAALRRSVRLVRGRFWTVLAVLLPIELIGDGLTRFLTNLPHHLFGERVPRRLGSRTSSRTSSTTPFYAVAAVLLTVELIREKEGTGPRNTLGPRPMTTASILADFWNDQIVAEEKQGLFFVLVGFLLSFGFIRMSTRLMRSPRVPWWPGSVVSESGVHLHHLVFGIVTMMISGAVGFTVLGDGPWAEICAFAFGVGAGLTIDEFALWVYLEDVYWSEQGRVSIDATVIAAGFMGLILLGLHPVRLRDRIASISFSAAWSRRRSSSGWSRSALPSSASCTGSSASSSSRSRSTARSGSASRAHPGRGAATASGTRPSRRRRTSASRPIAAPSGSRTRSATSSAASRARESPPSTQEALAATREAAEEVRQGVDRITHPGEGRDPK